MGILEDIWVFYQESTILLLEDSNIASRFIEIVAASMMYGKENDLDILESPEFYESLFKSILLGDDSEELQEEIGFAKNLPSILENEECQEESIENIKEAQRFFSKMSEVKRKGWIARNVPETHGESDAVHIMQMLALAFIYFKLDKSLNLDRKKVYEMIIIHEIGESLVGDIREGTKEHEEKAKLEKQAVKEIFQSLKSGPYFIKLWQEFESRETSEAEFVYQLDKIDPILKAKILDNKLNRNDLYLDFYGYEEGRDTYHKGKVKELFDYSRKMEVRNV